MAGKRYTESYVKGLRNQVQKWKRNYAEIYARLNCKCGSGTGYEPCYCEHDEEYIAQILKKINQGKIPKW